MARQFSRQQLTGGDDRALLTLDGGHRLLPAAAAAFDQLQQAASDAGFELAIGSSFRSFERQLAIWNGKAQGLRPVHDDRGLPVAMTGLSQVEKMHAILRFSALPGTSRHHWGTDLDVYDTAAVPADYQLQLSPAEVASGGVFDPLHCWLDQRMAAGESFGFYRPYSEDRGGVAAERWHLSYAPLSLDCALQFEPGLLRACWDELDQGEAAGLALRDEVEAALEEILARYVTVAPGWCPAQ